MQKTQKLPVTHDLMPLNTLSAVIALLMTGLSIAGLLFPSSLYPSEALRRSFVANDVVNLFIGLPILLGSLWLARRGRLIGLLFWPGALFYITYNYLAYALALPWTVPFAGYLVVVVLSIYAIFRLLSRVDKHQVQQRLGGSVSERLAGGLLAGFGVLFLLLRAGQVVNTLNGQAALAGPELAVAIADLLVVPTWILGGVLLWQRRALGYVTGAGLLFQASMLFIGLLVFFILQPVLTAAPFPLTDFVVVAVMGLVCFVPFGLFVRGVVAKREGAPL